MPEFTELERDSLLIRAALPAPLKAHPSRLVNRPPRFDPAMLAWLGFASEEEARAHVAWIDREAPEEYQDAVTARVLELDDGEDDRRRLRGW
jgi:hypothetical protein